MSHIVAQQEIMSTVSKGASACSINPDIRINMLSVGGKLGLFFPQHEGIAKLWDRIIENVLDN
jgi:hypothetical protein